MKNTDHIFVDFDRHCLYCKNCKDTYPLKLPISVQFLGNITKAFEKEHKNCKPKVDE